MRRKTAILGAIGFLALPVAAAFLGWCVGGLIIVNGLSLTLRVLKHAVPQPTLDVAWSIITAPAGFCAGAAFIVVARRVGASAGLRPSANLILLSCATAFLGASIFLDRDVSSLVVSLHLASVTGFFVGGLVFLNRGKKAHIEGSHNNSVEDIGASRAESSR